MMYVRTFTFNDFSENTYVLYDDSLQCVIVDPGCNNASERKELDEFISQNKLIPAHLVNTHCHIDHILGNAYVSETYDLPLTSHKGEKIVLASGTQISMMYQIPYTPSPDITVFLDDGDTLTFGNTKLEILFTPGHSPASICFYHRESKQIISGDVLFDGSIGRTDLPGGNFETLIRAIKAKIFTLHDDVIVYPGHGPTTTVGIEKRTNPFLVG